MAQATEGVHEPSNDTRQEQDDTDSIQVQQPSPKKLAHIQNTSQASTTVSNGTASSTGIEAGLSLTSPSVSGSTHQVALATSKRKRTPPVLEQTPSSALQRPTTKAQDKGSAQNPIVLEEYTPRRYLRTLPKPHGFVEESHKPPKASRRQYANHLFRKPLASKTTNGSTFTGDIGNDIHRMRTAKFAAGGYRPHTSPSVIGFGVPFEIHSPILAQHAAQQSSRASTTPQPQQAKDQAQQQTQPQAHLRSASASSMAQSRLITEVHRPKSFTFVPPLTPSNPTKRPTSSSSMPPPAPSEDALRRKALQHIRDHSRPQLLKKPLPADPDETSASESEIMSLPSSAASKRRKMTVYQDPNDHLTPLIAQSQVLTSLLQNYPKSQDKKGVREDVAMLVSVQNERLEMWMKHEGKGRKRAGSKSDASGNKGGETAAQEEKRKQDGDREMRGLLSAGATMWQDGSGEGVADVYQSEGREEND